MRRHILPRCYSLRGPNRASATSAAHDRSANANANVYTAVSVDKGGVSHIGIAPAVLSCPVVFGGAMTTALVNPDGR